LEKVLNGICNRRNTLLKHLPFLEMLFWRKECGKISDYFKWNKVQLYIWRA